MVDEKIDSVRQDVSNPSFSDTPSRPPVSSPFCQRQRDPSRSKPQSTYGKVGVQPVESEGAESAESPSNFLAMLRDSGVIFLRVWLGQFSGAG